MLFLLKILTHNMPEVNSFFDNRIFIHFDKVDFYTKQNSHNIVLKLRNIWNTYSVDGFYLVTNAAFFHWEQCHFHKICFLANGSSPFILNNVVPICYPIEIITNDSRNLLLCSSSACTERWSPSYYLVMTFINFKNIISLKIITFMINRYT